MRALACSACSLGGRDAAEKRGDVGSTPIVRASGGSIPPRLPRTGVKGAEIEIR